MELTARKNPRIEIRTGSDSDIPKIKEAYQVLQKLGIDYSPRILSAHRTPQIMATEAQKLRKNGFSVCIAAAGGSAHLPGMTASETLVPVVGLPVKTSFLDGVDSLYSIIQMPNGIPVGCVGIGRATDAALLAAQIAFLDDRMIRKGIRSLRKLPPISYNVPLVSPKVLIIKPDSGMADEKAMLQMVDFIKEIGLSVEEKIASNDLSNEINHCTHCAIIVILPMVNNSVVSHIYEIISTTEIPVIALPVLTGNSNTQNPLIFLDQMLNHAETNQGKPYFPVAGMGINRYLNAGIFAAQIAGLYFDDILGNLSIYRKALAEAVITNDDRLKKEGVEGFLQALRF